MKEAYVGAVFFGREPSYNPRHDSIVRVNVKRLRQKLAAYYAEEGVDDPVRIQIPLGSYVPTVILFVAPILDAASPRADEILLLPEPLPEVRTEPAPDAASSPPHSRRIAPGWRIWVSSAAILLLGGVLYLRAARKPRFAANFSRPTPLTAGGEMEFEPSTTRDGTRLAYVARSPRTTDYRIFLRPFADLSAKPLELDTGSGDAFYPQWSPDGGVIAFLHCDLGPCEIATIPSDGGRVRSVRVLPEYERPADHPYYQYRQLNPAWTADGKRLIYPYRGPSDVAERLVEQDLASGTMRQLSTGEIGDEDAAPSVSSDGRTLAFLRRHLSTTHIMTLDLQTLKPQELESEPNLAVSGLTWAPGDEAVVAGINRDTGTALLWIPLKGTPHELALREPAVMNPVLSGDGRNLMFLSANRTRNLAQVAGKQAPAPLFPSKQRNTFTAASPDGLHLAYLSDLSGRLEVWTMDRQRSGWSEGRQVTRGLGFYPSSLTWSPDDRYVAVGLSNTATIVIVNMASGMRESLRIPGMEQCDVWSPQWSADGRWIYFAAWGEKQGIFRAATGPFPEVQQVYAGSAREVRLDGGRAAYFGPNWRNGIFRIPLPQGDLPPSTLPAAVPVPGLEHLVTGRAWLVEDGRLLYIDAHEPVKLLRGMDLHTGLKSAESGPLVRLAFTDGTISYFGKDQLLIYSEWSEAAGSQIFSMTPSVDE